MDQFIVIKNIFLVGFTPYNLEDNRTKGKFYTGNVYKFFLNGKEKSVSSDSVDLTKLIDSKGTPVLGTLNLVLKEKGSTWVPRVASFKPDKLE